MRLTIVPMALVFALASSALAQIPGVSRTPPARRGPAPAVAPAPPEGVAAAAPASGANNSAPKDQKVFRSGDTLPAPTPLSDVNATQVTLPNEPIEPYLLTELTKDAGPFMVLAHTFRGPDAARYALALTLELRRDYNLPAWIYHPKVHPMRSNIYNIPPTAPPYVQRADVSPPEKTRMYDEAAVLVGTCKTLQESEKLLHQVKKIHPKCLDNMPTIWDFRKGKGLSRAIRTTNPFVPAQYLFPRKDPLVAQMNAGPLSIFKCPARYTLQVAEFVGRSTFNPDAKQKAKFESIFNLRQSPLAGAADNAQKVAEVLSRDEALTRAGYRAYVFHDRTTSKVMVGAFQTSDDPAATSLRKQLMDPAVQRRVADRTGMMLAPAQALTDLQTLPAH